MMKKTVLILVLVGLGISLFAQTSVADRMGIAPKFDYTPAKKEMKEEPVSVLQWNQDTHNFGTIDYNKPVTGQFVMTNTTNAPIIIKDAKGSCGCTGTNFPKEAIMPGETATITATYNAKNIGPFKKTVTVTTSADKKDSKGTVLHITGEVIWRL